jgi:hypothetical protein
VKTKRSKVGLAQSRQGAKERIKAAGACLKNPGSFFDFLCVFAALREQF